MEADNTRVAHALPSPLCIITDRQRAVLPLPHTLQQAVQGGARWIRVREPDLALSAYAALCHLLVEAINNTRVTWSVRPSAYLLLRSVWPELRLGVHLTSFDAPWGATHEEILTGRSVHVGTNARAGIHEDVRREVATEVPKEERAGAAANVDTRTAAGESGVHDERLDYRLLAPVFDTACKPDTLPIGPAAISGLLNMDAAPVIALGGVTAFNAAECLRAGAVGIAVCGGVMESATPHDAASEYLHALGQR